MSMPKASPLKALRGARPSLWQRIRGDELTRARLHYDAWYPVFEAQQGAYVVHKGRRLLMLSSNDYLGLSDHPQVVAAGQRALAQWGSSTTGARLANGTRAYHTALEERLAACLGVEAAHVFSAGYLACLSAVSTFASPSDTVLVDRSVHSSLWSGIRLSGARVERFSHNSPSDLQDLLHTLDRASPKLVVVEGVYSMEGHIAPLREMLDVAREHEAFFVVDDAHGFGVLGDRGQGTVGHLDATREVGVICGSLSKSLSSVGGFVAGSRAVIEYFRTHSKQALFSAALSPADAATALAALDLLEREPEHRERLWENTRYFRKILNQLGVDTWDSKTPAIPAVIGSKLKAFRVWRQLYQEGVFTVLALPPAVPPKRDLIRMAVSARHSHADLDFAGEALAKALRRH